MVMRLSGLSSGMDTESVIQVLVESKMTPITNLEDKVEDYEEKYANWNELDTKLTDLRSVSSDLTSYTTWRQKTVESTDSDYVDATVTGYSVSAESYDVHVTTLAKAQRIASDAQSSTSDPLGIAGDFTVGGELIEVTADQSLQDIRDSINAAAADMDDDEKVKSYIIGSQLLIERVETGNTDISITDGTNNILQSGAGGLGIFSGTVASPTATLKNELQESADLEATIDGIIITGSSNTDVSNAVDGVNFNFYREMDVGETETLTIGNDTDTIKSLISDFVEKYNESMAFVKNQSTVQLSSNTNDDSIVATGVLQGEPLLASINTRARSIISSQENNPNYMDQNFNSLYTVGIWFDSESNEISVVDEAKLDDALQNNFDEVMDLFRGWGEEDAQGVEQGAGIMRQFDDYIYSLVEPIEGTVSMRMDNIQKNISSMNIEIYDMTMDLQDYETQLWEHFANMETSVNDIQQQGQYLLSALGV